MGADLIGYHVMGPASLADDAETTAKAVTAVKACIRAFHALGPNWVAHWTDESGTKPSEELGHLDVLAIQAVLGRNDIDELLNLDAAQLVQDFHSAWNGDFRDSSLLRIKPDAQAIFCGELTWGDEPTGAGYLALRNGHWFGLFKFFQIEC